MKPLLIIAVISPLPPSAVGAQRSGQRHQNRCRLAGSSPDPPGVEHDAQEIADPTFLHEEQIARLLVGEGRSC